ncbi:MAG: ribose 5-phosphate isomerase B [Deltaproteobacteria bacterium]|nr:ribose 5-phosphate isomerase B [Deltaproteobacteria bacterium]
MRIALGADHGGYLLKNQICKILTGLGHDVTDFGCSDAASVDYPDYAEKVAQGVSEGVFDRGILICGTGIGMSIAANKFPGVRAALCHNIFTARLSREHNNANILTMGERVIGSGLAEEMVRVWVETDFEGGRHARRVEKICGFESK